MIHDEAHPMITIQTPTGEPYVSVIDAGAIVKIQLHKYDDLTNRIFLDIDKRALPELIKALETYEPW